MDSLKAEEKYFFSCFIEKCNEVLCPKIGKVISLYTYLDETNESRKQQEKQVQLDDPFIADRLRMISDHVDDEKCYKRETSLLRDAGYWSNKSFQENFRAISEWLWLLESDRYRKKVIREKTAKLQAQESERLALEKLRDEFLAEQKRNELQRLREIRRQNNSPESKENYKNAMVRLAMNGFRKSQKPISTPPGNLKPLGSTECFICNGHGITSIGRSCSKCLGRGFLR